MLPQKSILLEVAPPLLENGKASPTLHEFSRYLCHKETLCTVYREVLWTGERRLALNSSAKAA